MEMVNVTSCHLNFYQTMTFIFAIVSFIYMVVLVYKFRKKDDEEEEEKYRMEFLKDYNILKERGLIK